MSLYVDKDWLVADTEAELLAFTDKLELHRYFYKNDTNTPHFEVWGQMRVKAINAGAKVVSTDLVIFKSKLMLTKNKITL